MKDRTGLIGSHKGPFCGTHKLWPRDAGCETAVDDVLSSALWFGENKLFAVNLEKRWAVS